MAEDKRVSFSSIIVTGAYSLESTEYTCEQQFDVAERRRILERAMNTPESTEFASDASIDLVAAMKELKEDGAIERGLLSGETARLVELELENTRLKRDLAWAKDRVARNAELAEKHRENAAGQHLQVVNLTKKLNSRRHLTEEAVEQQLNAVLKERDDAKREVEELKRGTPKLHEPQLNPDGTVCLCQHCLKVIRNCEGLYVHKDGKIYHGGCFVALRAERAEAAYQEAVKLIETKMHKRHCEDCGHVFYVANDAAVRWPCESCNSTFTKKLDG